jgi:hypothetical protein
MNKNPALTLLTSHDVSHDIQHPRQVTRVGAESLHVGER